jgi:hypothetical protein
LFRKRKISHTRADKKSICSDNEYYVASDSERKTALRDRGRFFKFISKKIARKRWLCSEGVAGQKDKKIFSGKETEPKATTLEIVF